MNYRDYKLVHKTDPTLQWRAGGCSAGDIVQKQIYLIKKFENQKKYSFKPEMTQNSDQGKVQKEKLK